MLKTVKFGGSSLADAKGFRAVKAIIQQDPSRKIVVVSAPGKREKADSKVTDLLFLCCAHVKYGVNYEPILQMIEERYTSIAEELNIPINLEPEFQEIREHLKKKVNEEYMVSRGEYLCAKLLAAYLEYDFVDATEVIHIAYGGGVEEQETYEAVARVWNQSQGSMVLPGFYGTLPSGVIRLMARGGSDITGSLVAVATKSDVYENWTDVSGILMADPSIVKDPRPIPYITYDELQELTYMGAKVLHEESLYPVRKHQIPLNIRNTWQPENPGTVILESFEQDELNGNSSTEEFITGLAGRRDYSVIVIHRNHIGSKARMLRRVIDVFEKYQVPIEHMPFGIGALSIVVPSEDIQPNLYSIIADVEQFCGADTVTIHEGISLIAVVGRKMASRPGISGLLFGALGKHNISVRLISQGLEEINILIGVEDTDFEQAMEVLYRSFTKKEKTT